MPFFFNFIYFKSLPPEGTDSLQSGIGSSFDRQREECVDREAHLRDAVHALEEEIKVFKSQLQATQDQIRHLEDESRRLEMHRVGTISGDTTDNSIGLVKYRISLLLNV